MKCWKPHGTHVHKIDGHLSAKLNPQWRGMTRESMRDSFEMQSPSVIMRFLLHIALYFAIITAARKCSNSKMGFAVRTSNRSLFR